MEDLDALLADLQSSTAHINANQPGLVNNSRNSFQSDKDSGGSTPPPLPPPPPQDVLDKLPGSPPSPDCFHQLDGPLYEPQQLRAEIRVRERTPGSDTSSRNSDNIPPDKPAPPKPKMTQLSNNLSELDQLLQDLDSAQFMQEVDRKSSASVTQIATNGLPKQPLPPVAPKPGQIQRNSVDNLLDNLERSVPSPGYHSNIESQGVYEGVTPAVRPVQHYAVKGPGEKSASSATRELEDLMGSLSEFQITSQRVGSPAVNTSTTDTQIGDPAYAKPKKGRGTEISPTQTVEQTSHGSQLDTMLGDLQSDMNRQGVSTKTKGVCAACNKPVVGQIITALGKIWHLEHFVCDKCGEPLGTKNFYERDGLAYCETDYHNLFAPRCAYCNGPIIDKCITALNNTWHPDHFFCAMCGKNFGEEGFHEKDGQAYCRDDYFNMFAPKCGGCCRPIIDNYISALNRQWHPECFVCWDCRTPFGSGSFFDHEGLPYCETHYHEKRGSLCAGCQKPITGRCITAMFRKFHPEHFVCAFCLKQLNKGTFKEQNDKPYCHPCFVKLFS